MEKTQSRTFVEEVASVPGGEGIRLCIQCGTCTASCPTATSWEYTPSWVIAMVRAGMRQEVLSTSAMWNCLSCYSCTVRCPRGVKPTEVFHALESIAIQKGYQVARTTTPAMYKSFVDSIKQNGRVHEFGMMFKYYLSSNPFSALKLMPVAMQLYSHKRLSLQPVSNRGKEDLSKIIEKFNQVRGAQ
jgi:heterodisulfide reductase subunit C